jgi:hypothetical protein
LHEVSIRNLCRTDRVRMARRWKTFTEGDEKGVEGQERKGTGGGVIGSTEIMLFCDD